MTINPKAPARIDQEFITTLYEAQLYEWKVADTNYRGLINVQRRKVNLGEMEGAVQCNPARIVSTGAKIDPTSIRERKCFLCKDNRPGEQITIDWLPGWQLLVNPFPIFPVHFTIPTTGHRPQERIPLDMATMAERAPGLVIFYNGAHAGASAPDHMHTQAVLQSELPLIRLVESKISEEGVTPGFKTTAGLDLPFHFIWTVITPDETGMRALGKIPGAFGIDAESGQADRGLVNAFFWTGCEGLLRVAVVPRRRHRPLCYGTGNSQFVVSPGAIDMSGIIIAPREQDFNRLDETKIRNIYADVAFAEGIPEAVGEYFGL